MASYTPILGFTIVRFNFVCISFLVALLTVVEVSVVAVKFGLLVSVT